MSEYQQHIAQAARHYWGEPNHALSKGREIRFGNHGSKSVDLEKGTWFDHELNVGGGIADMIKLCEPSANIAERMESFGLPRADEIKKRETVWDYVDQYGEVRYQVVRIDDRTGKTYRQRRIDANGSPIWGMQGVTALPYRLDLLQSTTKTVFIVEGEKCADAMIARGLIATTNHGGAGKWWPPLTEHFLGRNVVIIPDNDAAGEKHALVVGNALTGTAKSIRILHLKGLDRKGDVADWLQSHKVEELIELAKSASLFDPLNAPDTDDITDPADRPRVELLPWSDLKDVKVKWLIKDLLPAQSFAALYGKPGSYKSFVALYLAAMIGSGRQAFGRETEGGDVIYLAGEGGAGLKARRDALMKKYDLGNEVRIHFIKAQLDLRSTEQDLELLIAAIQDASLKPCLVIIDTLARAFGGGNENSSEDMGAFISHIGRLQQALQAAVMIVHHSGKDEARGQRGHSSLLGAVDAELEVVKISDEDSPDRVGQLTITKQKDGEDGVKIGYRMETVQLSPIDPDRTSLVVEHAEDQSIIEPKKRLTKIQQLVMDALQAAVAEAGELTNGYRIPSNVRTVKVDLWRTTYYEMSPAETEAKKKSFRRASLDLITMKMVATAGDRAWIIYE